MNQPEKEGVSSVSKRIISAAIVGWLFVLAGVFLSALVFHFLYLPEGAIPWVSGILTYIAALICGFFAAKGARKKGFLKGFWAGVLFVAIYLVLALIFSETVRVGNALVLLILSVLGGIIGINANSK